MKGLHYSGLSRESCKSADAGQTAKVARFNFPRSLSSIALVLARRSDRCSTSDKRFFVAVMAGEKRDASPSASTAQVETPSKRQKLDDKPGEPAAAPAASAIAPSNAAATSADGDAPSSPAPVARETDSPSSRGKQRGGRGGGRGGSFGDRRSRNERSAAGKHAAKGRGRDRNDEAREGSRNAETAAKAAAGDAAGANAAANDEDKRDKLPKKKVALLIGYSGLGYKGSQM